jgi:hypothetical protein
MVHNKLKARIARHLLGIVAITVLSTQALGGGQGASEARVSEESWTVRLVLLSDPRRGPALGSGANRAVLWVGLKRGTPQQPGASLVCIRSFGYGIGEGELAVKKGSASPHACQADEAFALVLRSETVFLPMSVELPALWDESAKVSLTMVLREKGAQGKGVDTEVVWHGSIGELLKDGKALLGPA